MTTPNLAVPAARPLAGLPRTGFKTFLMAAGLLVLGAYLVYPLLLLLVMSFNTAPDVVVPPYQFGLTNWTQAWSTPGIFESLRNSFIIWASVLSISFPTAVAISLVLARTNIPHTHKLEFMFWIAYIFPSVATTLGWIMLMAPEWGFLNKLAEMVPFVEKGPFNIYSVPGIVWAKLMGDGIAFKVILLTPAFRNMDGALEEASRVSGSSNLRTMLRVTIPMMISPIVLILSLQLVRMFQGFDTEYILGAKFGFFVYSTQIYRLVRLEVIPQYQQAVVLASVTLLLIAIVIPLQQWIVGRRRYTTVDSAFRPGLIDLGRFRGPIFAVIVVLTILLTVAPAFVIFVGSFMARVGFFNTTPLFTPIHWQKVLGDRQFQTALATTLTLATTAGVLSPILFSLLAYVIVRTRMAGRSILDGLIWLSAAMPGILVGLGLLLMYLTTPGLKVMFGTIWILLIVVVISGVTTGTNVFKGVLVQIGASLEEAGRVSGAGWIRTYFRIVIPVLMPTMVLVGMLNFVAAASMTSNVILLASRETNTLSILALQFSASGANLEEAGIISLIIMLLTMGVALPMRALALRLGVRHDPAGGHLS